MHSITSIKNNNSRQWMVAYTRSRYEKKVDQLLRLQNIESYCPIVKSRRKWADRYKMVEMPLFPSYVFINVKESETLKVLQTMGVINFVHYNGRPATIRDTEIESIREISNQYTDIEPVSINAINIGDTVSVKNGILFDLHGEVVEIQGKSVLMVMKQLDCALVAKIKLSNNQVILTSA